MIELKYVHLNDPDFGKALRKLVDSEEIKKTETLLKICRIYKGIGDADKERLDLHQKLLRAYGVQDPDSKTHKLYIPAAKQDEWEVEYKKLMQTPFKIDQEKLKLSEITPAKPTAADLCGLTEVMES